MPPPRVPVNRLTEITASYPALRIVIAGDFCLDRYLEIDPARVETSIETGLPVHNVVHVRFQPGGAGTILNNVAALGAESLPVGFRGQDAEGWELRHALAARPKVVLDHFIQTASRRTFTYVKPLLLQAGHPPVELSRLDLKNWTPTPPEVTEELIAALRAALEGAHALILLDQVDVAGTGVINGAFLEAMGQIRQEFPRLFVMADSRRGLADFPPTHYKMNAAELARLAGSAALASIHSIQEEAARLAARTGHFVFITLAENGMVGASPDAPPLHIPALPLRGEIDIVGAGDAVTANLAAACAAGASLEEAMTLAITAASIVIHQLGTTGTASVPQILALAHRAQHKLA